MIIGPYDYRYDAAIGTFTILQPNGVKIAGFYTGQISSSFDALTLYPVEFTKEQIIELEMEAIKNG